MKYSCVIAISRDNEYFTRCMKSIVLQHPDEIIACVEPHLMDNEIVNNALDRPNVVKRYMHIDKKLEKIHHMVNVAVNTYQAIADASHKWVRTCDDDDEWFRDITTQSLLTLHAKDNIGIIHGQVLNKTIWPPRVRDGGQMYIEWDCKRKYIGSGNFVNRDAFREVADIAIETAPVCEAAFLDWRIAYWVMWAGYLSTFVPEVFSVQHKDKSSKQNSDLQFTSRRDKWVGKWPLVVSELVKASKDK